MSSNKIAGKKAVMRRHPSAYIQKGGKNLAKKAAEAAVAAHLRHVYLVSPSAVAPPLEKKKLCLAMRVRRFANQITYSDVRTLRHTYSVPRIWICAVPVPFSALLSTETKLPDDVKQHILSFLVPHP